MEYPKKIMKTSELVKMGFPEAFLERAYYSKGQTFAQKINPLKANSPIMFYTEGFEKWRAEQMKLEQKSRGRGMM